MKRLEKKRFFTVENNPSFQRYLYFGQILVFSGMIAYYSVFFLINGNPLLARVGNPYSGHTISWLVILTGALIIRLKTPYKDYPIYYAVQSFLAFMLAAMITEGIWHLFYLSVKLETLTLSTKLQIVLGITAAFIAGTYDFFSKRKFWLVIAVLIAYFVVWRFFICIPSWSVVKHCMPVSLEIGVYETGSRFYNDDLVNLLEVSQWIIGMSLFTIAYTGSPLEERHGV